MWSIFKLINSYYWRGVLGPFFAFFFPFLLIFLVGNITYSSVLSNLKDLKLLEVIIADQMIKLGKQIIGGVLISTIAANGLISFPTIIMEFKKTVLIKRISSANLKIQHFLLISLMYQLIWTLFSFLWIPIIGTVVLGANKYLNFNIGFNIGLLNGVPFLILIYIIAMSIGLLIASLSKSFVAASSVANIVYFPIAFLSGGFGNGLPNLSFVPVLKFIANYMIPTNYGVEPFYKVFEKDYHFLWKEMGWTSYGYPIFGLIIAAVFFSLSIVFFKYGSTR